PYPTRFRSKRGLEPLQSELGIYVCGGRGRHSRRTPTELAFVGERTGLDGDSLAQTSRLVAKIDSAAVQDGFDLYLHAFIVSTSRCPHATLFGPPTSC